MSVMKKMIYALPVLAFLIFSLLACEKDNISSDYMDANPKRMEVLAKDAREILASSETGWVMMVKTNLNSEAYTPIVLNFDTLKNRVYVKTIYGETAATESYYRVAGGTGAPQLIFTSGSIMSTLYRFGVQASDITDHIYNIIGVNADTVTVQCYRSGKVYAQEGGEIYKMFKRPTSWKWADEDRLLDMSSAAFRTDVAAVPATMQIDYVNDPSRSRLINTQFNTMSTPIMTTAQFYYPFQIARNIGTGGFDKPFYFNVRFPHLTYNPDAAPVQANNVLCFFPQPGHISTFGNINNFINAFNFHYLACNSVVRTGQNVKMEFEAYDKKGNVIVKASYNNMK